MCEYVCGVAWRGVAWRGVAWRGVAWRGVAWRGVAWRGVAWRGVAWRGVAWRGVAWRGVVYVCKREWCVSNHHIHYFNIRLFLFNPNHFTIYPYQTLKNITQIHNKLMLNTL